MLEFDLFERCFRIIHPYRKGVSTRVHWEENFKQCLFLLKMYCIDHVSLI